MACNNDFLTRKNLEKIRLQAINHSKSWKVDVIIFIEDIQGHGKLFCFEEVGKKPGRHGVVETIKFADVRNDKSIDVLQTPEVNGVKSSDNPGTKQNTSKSRNGNGKVDGDSAEVL